MSGIAETSPRTERVHTSSAISALAPNSARPHAVRPLPRDCEAEDLHVRLVHLETAVLSHEVVGRAQGILMERHRLTADEAFDRLRVTSQHLNRKLIDIAQDLVDTGREALPPALIRSLCERP